MLEIRDLAYRYPGAETPALAGITLAARRGAILGLLGPNGAGKTTLISHLAGLLDIQQGSIAIDGVPLATARRQDPTRIAVAPQEYAFYPTLTVTENLRCFAAASRLSGAAQLPAIARCLAFTQLERCAATRAERLSGGLKRRLNLAIALLADPALILLDEPTVGVDPQSRAFILDAVRALAAQGTAVIYTSHYMEEIEAIADDVAIVDHGRLLRHGALASLLAEGASHLEMTVPGGLAATGKAQLAAVGDAEANGERIVVALHAGASAVDLLATLQAGGERISAASFGRYNLEQLFMHLTHRSLRDD
jgi:ABC-2 type transport system ATP-binding protein